jgi:hypothetical protein
MRLLFAASVYPCLHLYVQKLQAEISLNKFAKSTSVVLLTWSDTRQMLRVYFTMLLRWKDGGEGPRDPTLASCVAIPLPTIVKPHYLSSLPTMAAKGGGGRCWCSGRRAMAPGASGVCTPRGGSQAAADGRDYLGSDG